MQSWVAHVAYRYWKLLNFVAPARARALLRAREDELRRARLILF